MAKKKEGKPETKSEFLRKALTRNPNLDFRQINRRWARAGHPGEISNALYYQVRSKLGIRTVWEWVRTVPPSAGEPDFDEIYQFKITLLNTKPEIWRRIQTRDCSLDRLHEHIQTAMGWTNSHLHHFKIKETFYGDPMLMAENFRELGYKDSLITKLSDLPMEDSKPLCFWYEYDFGDSWEHEILLEKRLPTEPGKEYPNCLEGARACPPEDVGGVWGYANFLEAIADPNHPDHDEMRTWTEKKFDPKKFSPLVATRRMREGLPDWRSLR